MHRLFGRAKPEVKEAEGPTITEHIGNLEKKVPELDAKINSIDKELVGLKAQLAKLPPSRQAPIKQKALQLLKRRKMYEAQRGQVQTRAFNMEATSFAIDNVKGAQEQFKVMQRATAELKKEQAGIDMGALEDMHDDMQDMLADNEELNEIMGRSYDTYDGVDEADLDAELEGLEGDLAQVEAAAPPAAAEATHESGAEAVPGPYSLPAAPVYASPYGNPFPSVPTSLPATAARS